jgi:hypothetical protein
MVIAYPLTVQKDYTELKFSLRSIEKYISTPYEILIIGDIIPDWLVNITWIKLGDVPGRKQLSIRRKILAALEYADEILFMNDDVFLLEPATEFPYYYNGSLKNYSESGSKPLMKQLQAMGKSIKHFDGHFGLIYDQRFKEVSEQFTESVIIKSMYCNYLGMEGVERPDCKLISKNDIKNPAEFIKGLPCFSTGEYSLKSALSLLNELFPFKSKNEV